MELNELKNYMDKIGSGDKKETMTQVVKEIVEVNNATQFGVLSSKERAFIFEMEVVNKLFFNDSPRLRYLINNFELLSKSQDGTALKLVADLFKTENNNNTTLQLNNPTNRRF